MQILQSLGFCKKEGTRNRGALHRTGNKKSTWRVDDFIESLYLGADIRRIPSRGS